MRIIFAIDMMGQASEIGEMLQLAIATCLARTSLEPTVLAPDFRPSFRAWLEQRGVTCMVAETPLAAAIQQANRRSGYPLQAAGNYLRYEACTLFDDEIIVYADCDVIFLSDFVMPQKPNFLAAGPEDAVDDLNRINSGVLLFNVKAMRAALPGFYAFATENLERFYPGYDQPAINEYFLGRIDRLPLTLNWRPYWGPCDDAAIVHFHGVKPSLAERLLNGIYTGPPERRELVTEIVQRTLSCAGFFIRQIENEGFHELSYFVKIKTLINQVEALQRQPLKLHCAQMISLRESLEQRLRALKLQTLTFATRGPNNHAIMLAEFNVADALQVRLVFSASGFLGLGDLLERDGGLAANLDSATVGNIKILEKFHIGTSEMALVDILDEGMPVDVIFNIQARLGVQRELRFSICAIDKLAIKIYLSRSGQFTESAAFWVTADVSPN